HNATQKRLDLAHAALQKQRAISNARAERDLQLREANSRIVRDNEALAVGSQRTLDDVADLRQALDRLEAKGMLNTGPTVWDKARLSLAIQSAVGDTEAAHDLN